MEKKCTHEWGVTREGEVSCIKCDSNPLPEDKGWIKDIEGNIIGIEEKVIMTREDAQRLYPDAKLPFPNGVQEPWEETIDENFSWPEGIEEIDITNKDIVCATKQQLKSFIKALLQSEREKVLRDILEDINRVLTIQYSGVRPDSEFEKGYTRAYENMRATVKKCLSLESEE